MAFVRTYSDCRGHGFSWQIDVAAIFAGLMATARCLIRTTKNLKVWAWHVVVSHDGQVRNLFSSELYQRR